MARKHKENRFKTRTRSDPELLKVAERSLDTLEQLCAVYDGGFAAIAFSMATELHNLLSQNTGATKVRGQIKFPSLFMKGDDRDYSRMLNALHQLTIARIGGNPPVLDFIPKYEAGDGLEVSDENFRDWWNREVIYRASAAPPGTPAGMIPVNDSPTVPFKDRETITRRELITLLRNNDGSHTGAEYAVILEELNDTLGWGSFGYSTPDGDFSTDDGTLVTRTPIIAAMVRQIVWEVLVAYGRISPAEVQKTLSPRGPS